MARPVDRHRPRPPAVADDVLVTQDSANMAAEAASTGKPVHILPMVPLKPADKFARLHADLRLRGAAVRWSAGKLDLCAARRNPAGRPGDPGPNGQGLKPWAGCRAPRKPLLSEAVAESVLKLGYKLDHSANPCRTSVEQGSSRSPRIGWITAPTEP
jgi:hypothetical protein